VSDDFRKLVVAREAGLDASAVPWLVGESVAELEESAVNLRELRERESPEPARDTSRTSNPFSNAAAATKAERKARLRDVITGRAAARAEFERLEPKKGVSFD
jgi:hypothetical protein